MRSLMNFIIVCQLLFVSNAASTMPINYITQERYVEASEIFLSVSSSVRTDSFDFGLFDESVSVVFGSASQISNLAFNSITAVGSGRGSSGPPAGSSSGGGTSFFFTSFEIFSPVNYTLDFNISSELGSYRLQGPSLAFEALSQGGVRSTVNQSGTLASGTYEFEIDMFGGTFIPGDFQLNFTVSNSVKVIPIPAAGWLFGSTIIGLFGFRKQSNG